MIGKQKILIVDDDENIAELISLYLTKECFDTKIVHNGEDALSAFETYNPNLVLLDLMLPGIDGYQVCREIRAKSATPIIMLSAKGEVFDKVLGLELGADDYITKPFNPVEVQARVKSQLRRYMQLGGGNMTKKNLAIGGIELDDSAKVVTLDGDAVSLTPTEYDILKLFMEQPGVVFSPKDIYRKVWKDAPFGSESTVAVHIRHLREKLEYDPANPRYLKVVWGQGYKMERGNTP